MVGREWDGMATDDSLEYDSLNVPNPTPVSHQSICSSVRESLDGNQQSAKIYRPDPHHRISNEHSPAVKDALSDYNLLKVRGWVLYELPAALSSLRFCESYFLVFFLYFFLDLF